MSKLFERYIQYVVSRSLIGLDGSVKLNSRIQGSGQRPPWALKYLEPDMLIKHGSKYYVADAKYKAHYYSARKDSEVLKDTHRSDLHQLLAYCSFSPEKNKTGILFYPSDTLGHVKVGYLEPLFGVHNTVFLYGIPFGINRIEESIKDVRDLLASTVS